MAEPTRSRLANDERRAQLLEVGLQLFGARAYDEVGIDDIAHAAGMSKGLLYHYFGGKRAFYLAVVTEAAHRLDAATAPDPTMPPRARAVAGLDGYLDFVEERAIAFTTLMRGGLGADPAIAEVVDATRKRILRRFLEGLGLHDDRPVFRTAVLSWLGAVEAASLDWLAHRDIDRPTLTLLLLGSLAAHLTGAAELDPEAPVGADEIEALRELLDAMR